MDGFAFEDVTNIALLCFLLGIGFFSLAVLSFAYIAALFFLESWND